MKWHIFLPFLTVVLGAVAALLLKPKSFRYGKLLLAFSGAFLLSATVSELLPEIFETNGERTAAFLLLGVLLQIVLEFFSKGAEHGHLHASQIRSFPFLLFLSLCIHAFLEGMPLQGDSGMTYGISVHKLPIAFILTAYLIQSGYNKWTTVLVLLVFSVMSPMGSLLADALIVDESVMQAIKAVVAGIVLHVSTTLILEASENHRFNFAKVAVMVLGGLLGYFL